ncbi:MAG: Hsp20/alpha crystallin family protein [Methanomicrobiaceae archaeon]|uniref:Small heat shock protein n=1 Tax=hydrocarbon metagenome TaxID=938273 RepID=A0A0W8FEI1_9ZZZZ|nr:Hsp20/alpha crystallin family protein [Methanomicrobiaceae archaeon]MDD5418613.1 Hsp20/alpha crystallin family protein [Methanomicrobiaceae archaeon]
MEEKESPYECRCAFGENICEMHRRFHDMTDAVGRAGERSMPVIRGAGIPVDVRETGDEIVVAADLPGMEGGDVTIRLTRPATLKIHARRRKEEEKGYAVRERASGEMIRIVDLPADATDEGSSADLRNGVLTVRLKKIPEEREGEIPVRGEE